MTTGTEQSLSLGEAATRFLAKLSEEERAASQQEVYRFVRWYGEGKALAELKGQEIASYAEQLSASDTDYARKLDLIRAFLGHAKKAGWSKANLGVHLKTKKKTPAAAARQCLPEVISLTQQGYTKLKNELAALLEERHEVIDEMRRAAADKDFRENAPLHAARERRGHLEGRIKELEETLKLAVVINSDQKVSAKANIGDVVVLSDLASGETLHYRIVNAKEVDPTKGKVSSVSPIGRAIIGRRQGDAIEVMAPVGKLCYRIERIEH
ncbi:MAG: GreA/GreB family elongation factor [Dehalococcoidales bacterium]|nr:GreA/GreB family elongation factor [Dehalococcoidales bacterium]